VKVLMLDGTLLDTFFIDKTKDVSSDSHAELKSPESM